jgi:hypothetical protein
MPAYTVQFTTPEGADRAAFTLDPARPLGPQVRQVLEELRQRGTVIAGAPGDEIAVEWNGRELDLARAPAELGVTPAREMVIRMRPAAAPAPRATAAAVRRRPRRFTRGAFAAPMTGVAGALLAWGASSALRDLAPAIPTYARLDLAVATLLGAAVVAFVIGGAALRTQAPPLRAAALGLLLGVAGGAAGAALGTAAAGAAASFPLQRVLAWAVLGGSIAVAAALRWVRRDPRRLLEAGGCGVLGGAAAGAVFTLAGPGDFWQALAFAAVGAASGFGACSLAVRRAAGVVELEGTAGRAPGLLGHREWEVADGTHLRIHAGWRGEWAEAVVARQDGRTWAAPAAEGETVRVASRRAAAPVPLADADAIDVGGSRFRYRDFAGAA